MDTPSIEVPSESLSILWKSMTDDEKRQRIVDAVLSLVGKHGVQWATTARIAATVGVSEPTLYRTFRNRKEMLLAAADEIWEQRHSELESFESSDAMDFLRKICASHTVGIRTTRVVRFITELAVSHTGDGLHEHIRDLQFDNVRRLAEVVEQGKAEGSIRSDVDSWETAWSIQTVYWLEAMARLHSLEEHVLTGFSTRRFQAILDDIVPQPLAAQANSDSRLQAAESVQE
jgi:AcrR family transcriptional regulator